MSGKVTRAQASPGTRAQPIWKDQQNFDSKSEMIPPQAQERSERPKEGTSRHIDAHAKGQGNAGNAWGLRRGGHIE